MHSREVDLVIVGGFLTSPSSLGPFLRSEMWVTP